MSLNYNLTEIENYQEVCYIGGNVDKMSPVTHALIFATINNGFGEITEKNAAEFYARCAMLDCIFGALYSENRITPETVKEHIGLRTNGAHKTRAQFLRDLGTWLDDRVREYKQGTAEVDSPNDWPSPKP